jgi:uncharacterized phage protein (TIGR01671 family)
MWYNSIREVWGMREIKFRGKDEDTGEWRYGGYHKHQIIEICPVQFDGESEEDKMPKYIHYIIMDGFADWNMEKPIMKSNVVVETIGQYTGLKDKNGKEIYEGDIFIDDEFQLTYICVFEEGCFCLKCYGFVERYVSDNATNEFWEEINCDPISFYEIKNMEIIGNIYENPELLGE